MPYATVRQGQRVNQRKDQQQASAAIESEIGFATTSVPHLLQNGCDRGPKTIEYKSPLS